MKNHIEFCNEQKNKSLQPRIYIACLAAYNNGYLHAEWIDADQCVVNIYDNIKKILACSPIPDAEEFAIHDYEDFGDVFIHEYAGIDTVSAIANFVAEHGALGSAVLAHVGGDIDDASRILEECYYGEYNSEEDFTMSFAEDTMTIPDHLSYYIDYEKMSRDLFINDFFSIEVNHKVHVFSHS